MEWRARIHPVSVLRALAVLAVMSILVQISRVQWQQSQLRLAETASALGLQEDLLQTLSVRDGEASTLSLGAAVMLVHPQWRSLRGKRTCFFNASLDALQAYWRPTNPYPLYLLTTQSFDESDQSALRSRWPGLQLIFLDVSQFFPASIPGFDKFLAPETKKFSLGYRHMCTFLFYKLLKVRELRSHRYLLRVDDDACLQSDVGRDLFAEMAQTRSAYAYVSTFLDPPYVTKGLYEFSRDYMAEHKLVWSNAALAQHERRLASRGRGVSAFATNWEILDTLRYRQADILRFIQAVHSSGKMYSHRWGDAPLRYLLATMFWGPHDVRKLCNVRYHHGDWPPFPTCTNSTNDDPITKYDLVRTRRP